MQACAAERAPGLPDGGIRVPCYLRWPDHFPARLAVDKIAAHIDIMPTLLEACSVAPPQGLKLDGKSLLPLLTGKQTAGWPGRTLYFQWHRGDQPEPGRAFAARSQTYKLLRREPIPGAKPPPLELFDMDHDPLELEDVAVRHRDIVSSMHKDYLAWFKDVSATRGYAPSPIELGGTRENPSVLTRQDWRGPPLAGPWNPQTTSASWHVQVARDGRFDVAFRFSPRPFPTELTFTLNGAHGQQSLKPGETEFTFKEVPIKAGPGRLEAWVEGNRARAGILDAVVQRESVRKREVQDVAAALRRLQLRAVDERHDSETITPWDQAMRPMRFRLKTLLIIVVLAALILTVVVQGFVLRRAAIAKQVQQEKAEQARAIAEDQA